MNMTDKPQTKLLTYYEMIAEVIKEFLPDWTGKIMLISITAISKLSPTRC